MDHKPTKNTNHELFIYCSICGFLPFWWRFWQCINKYYNTRVYTHLLNAGKYSSKLIPPAITCIYAKSNKTDGDGFAIYLVFELIATNYCLIWDFYMDWGLFRSTKSGKYALREKLGYPVWFYYFAMVVNTLLRYFWVLSMIHFRFTKEGNDAFMNQFEILMLCGMFAEALRRTQWSLLRVENEFFNNFENYRTI